MDDLVSLIQAIVRDQLRSFKTTELGVVTQLYSHESASDRNNYECDVRLRDSQVELKRVPVSTGRVGAVAIPNDQDLVLVDFLHGDIHSAVITGRLYNDQERPPEAKPHEMVYISPDQPESGTRRVYMEFPAENKLLLDDDKVSLEMGTTKVTINHDGEVKVETSSQNIRLTDGNNTIELKSGQIKVEAQAKVVVEAPQIELVDGASHPMIYGDQLIQYLNQVAQIYQSHTHPGQMAGPIPVTPAPPVPPLPPATPSLLSMKVKTG